MTHNLGDNVDHVFQTQDFNDWSWRETGDGAEEVDANIYGEHTDDDAYHGKESPVVNDVVPNHHVHNYGVPFDHVISRLGWLQDLYYKRRNYDASTHESRLSDYAMSLIKVAEDKGSRHEVRPVLSRLSDYAMTLFNDKSTI